MADQVSVVRRNSRKKKLALTQEEIDEDGFRFTRRSQRLTRKSDEPTKSNKKQASGIKKPKRDESGENVKKVPSFDVVEKSEKLVEPADVEDKIVSKETMQKKKLKNKRRSSFIRGRKLHDSLELYESQELVNVKGLYKDIPAELSSDKRLQLLWEKSLMIMSERLKIENCDSVPNFVDKAEELISYLKTTLEQQSLCRTTNNEHEKTQERIIIPNPRNEQLEKYAKESEQVTKRMTQEDKEWEDLLQKYQNPPAGQVEDANNNVATLDTLSTEQQEFLKSSLPFNEMTKNLETVKLKSHLMIDKIYKTTEKLKTFNKVTGNYVEDGIRSLGKKTFECVDGTPRRIIHGALGNKK